MKHYFTQLETPQVDSENGIIRMASLISAGDAKGHFDAKGRQITVDEVTLEQIFKQCKKLGTVKLKADHGSGVFEIVGWADNFALTADKVLADLHLYESEAQRNRLLEIASTNPHHMGISMEFTGADKPRGTVCLSRCDEVFAAALVDDPAANSSLFSKKHMEEQRDKDGKWTSGGGSASSAPVAAAHESKHADIIKSALDQMKSSAGYHVRPDLVEKAVKEGLKDGDSFPMGSGIVAHIEDGHLIGKKDGKELNKVPVEKLNEAQIHSLLKSKAISASIKETQKLSALYDHLFSVPATSDEQEPETNTTNMENETNEPTLKDLMAKFEEFQTRLTALETPPAKDEPEKVEPVATDPDKDPAASDPTKTYANPDADIDDEATKKIEMAAERAAEKHMKKYMAQIGATQLMRPGNGGEPVKEKKWDDVVTEEAEKHGGCRAKAFLALRARFSTDKKLENCYAASRNVKTL